VPVGLWYGLADRIVPVAMGRYLVDAIPTAEGHFSPEYGHLSTVVETESAVFAWLSQ
jgi:pimeloyl-ACP methyl ester carboxylesterase